MTFTSKRSATVALTIGAAVLALAACGGGGVVSVERVGGTDVLADSSGRTLYTANVEKGGRILCTGGCTSFWEPVTTSAGQSESAAAALDLDLGVAIRPDGGRQLTFMGLPLYRFTEEGPGELTGDGFVDVFEGTRFEWLAATPGQGPEPADSGRPGFPY